MRFLFRLMGFAEGPLTQERAERLARDWFRANVPIRRESERYEGVEVVCEPSRRGDYWYADVWTDSTPERHLRIWPSGAIEEDAR